MPRQPNHSHALQISSSAISNLTQDGASPGPLMRAEHEDSGVEDAAALVRRVLNRCGRARGHCSKKLR